MNLKTYLSKRRSLPSVPQPRAFCRRCQCPQRVCYCQHITPFESHPVFVILIHPLEAKRTVTSGRMTHLCLSNSYSFVGKDFSHHDKVNSLIQDPRFEPYLLFPKDAQPLEILKTQAPSNRTPLIFVIDGTWHLANQIYNLSNNLKGLPSLSIQSSNPSRYIFRRQPRPYCLSTIEAVHQAIETLSPPSAPQKHDQLLEVFDQMVARQLSFTPYKYPTNSTVDHVLEHRTLKRKLGSDF